MSINVSSEILSVFSRRGEVRI